MAAVPLEEEAINNRIKKGADGMMNLVNAVQDRQKAGKNIDTSHIYKLSDQMEESTFEIYDSLKDHVNKEMTESLDQITNVKKHERLQRNLEREQKRKGKKIRKRYTIFRQIFYCFLTFLCAAYFWYVIRIVKNPIYKHLGWLETLVHPFINLSQTLLSSIFRIRISTTAYGRTETEIKERERTVKGEVTKYAELRDSILDKIVKIETLQQKALNMGSPTGSVTKQTEKDLNNLQIIAMDCDEAIHQLNYGHKDIEAAKIEFGYLSQKMETVNSASVDSWLRFSGLDWVMKGCQDLSITSTKFKSGGAAVSSFIWMIGGFVEMIKSFVYLLYNLGTLSIEGMMDLPKIFLLDQQGARGLLKLITGVISLTVIVKSTSSLLKRTSRGTVGVSTILTALSEIGNTLTGPVQDAANWGWRKIEGLAGVQAQVGGNTKRKKRFRQRTKKKRRKSTIR